MKRRFCNKGLCEKSYRDHLLRKHPNENASSKCEFAGQKTIFVNAKPRVNEIAKDLNEIIPSVSVSTNENQTSPAFTEKSSSFAENYVPVTAKSVLFA